MSATCGRCGAVHSVQIAGIDFRCETCAVVEVEEAAKRTTRTGLKIIAVGVALLGFAVLMGMANWDPGYAPAGDSYEGDMGLLFYVGMGAVGLFGIGFGMLKYRPRLRR